MSIVLLWSKPQPLNELFLGVFPYFVFDGGLLPPPVFSVSLCAQRRLTQGMWAPFTELL
jgi:hypothetical protein